MDAARRGVHTGDPHRGPAQGTHTGDPHRGEGLTEDPPPEGGGTQGTHTEHTQTGLTRYLLGSTLTLTKSCKCQGVRVDTCNRHSRRMRLTPQGVNPR